MKTVLVVGGSSFIGVYTVNALLEAGYRVVATGRNPRFVDYYKNLNVDYIKFDLGNVEDIEKLPQTNIDGVVLLAGLLPANSASNLEDEDNAADYFVVNAAGTARLLEYARMHGANRVIATTSYVDVQDSWSAAEPIREDWNRNFRFTGDHAAYVISKNASCDIMEYYNQQHRMKNMIFRLPPVYGVGPHNALYVNGIWKKSGIGGFIDRAKAGEPIVVFGDADRKRDIVYVKDVAKAFVLALSSDSATGLYNIGSGCAVSLKEQAEIIARVFSGENGESAVTVDPSRDNGIMPYSMSIEKAAREFGYSPRCASFKDLMEDWKFEEERGVFTSLFGVN